jgi:outer membrane protein assembly factor BamB
LNQSANEKTPAKLAHKWLFFTFQCRTTDFSCEKASLQNIGFSIIGMEWEGLSVTIERPDGTTETLRDIDTDSTGGTGRVYVPTITGNYTLQTHFPEQVTVTGVKMAPGIPAGTTMLASSSEKLTLVVQEEPTPYYPEHPLPTEYWTRPIDAQHREWHAIAGNWIGYPRYDAPFVPYNEGPETGHVLWAKPLATGGLAGELMGRDNLAHAYECGDAYEGKFAASVILGGVLYYNQFEERGQPYAEQIVVAVDLKTGEELWAKPLIGRTGETTGATVPAAGRVIDGISEQFPEGIGRRLAFGQMFYWDSYNYHGVFGYLWTTVGNTWMAFDAFSGRWIYTIINVPSGTTMYGVNGELLRRTQNLAQGWIALWNTSAIVSMEGSWRPHGNVYNAAGTGAAPARAWMWNVTIPAGLPGSIREVALGDRAVGVDVSTTAVRSWAVSLAPGDEGRLLFNKEYAAPAEWAAGNVSVSFRRISLEDGVFTLWIKETREYYGFSAETGNFLWKTEPMPYLDIYASSRDAIAYGKLFAVGYGGILNAFDIKTGEVLWTYEAKDPYNEMLWGPNWPLYMGFITDGKIYVHSTEHSTIDPKPRGALFYCVDVETGEEVFTLNIRGHHWGESPIIGDSVIAMYNSYDGRIYAIGKGPSATTVTAPNVGVPLGKSVLVSGMVTDVSPGTKDAGLTMRFPNGVPTVADECISDYMQYVYMQFPHPADVAGVEVILTVLDPNNNSYEVGRTISDESGTFGLAFEPEVPGTYKIIATFEGSKAYYGSQAIAYINVEEAPAPPPEATPPPASVADVYFVPAIVGLLVAIIAVGALMVLMLRKR